MNIKHHHRVMTTTALATIATLLTGIATSTFATLQIQDRQQETQSSAADEGLRTVEVYETNRRQAGQYTHRGYTFVEDDLQISVTVENDNVTAEINGERVPESQIKRDGDHIIILDEEGNVLHKFAPPAPPAPPVPPAPPEGWSTWNTAQVAPAAQPPAVMLGVMMDSPDAALRKHLQLEEGESTLIIGLHKGLPAHEAGLELYDVITQVDGAIASPQAIRKAMHDKEPGDTVTMTVRRGSKEVEIEVELAEYERQRFETAEVIGGQPQARARTGPGSDVFLAPTPSKPGQSFTERFVWPEGIDENSFEFFVTPPLRGNQLAIEVEIQRSIEEAMKKARESLLSQEAIEQYHQLLEEQLEKAEALREQANVEVQELREGGLEKRLNALNQRLDDLEQTLDRLMEELRDGSR